MRLLRFLLLIWMLPAALLILWVFRRRALADPELRQLYIELHEQVEKVTGLEWAWVVAFWFLLWLTFCIPLLSAIRSS